MRLWWRVRALPEGLGMKEEDEVEQERTGAEKGGGDGFGHLRCSLQREVSLPYADLPESRTRPSRR